MSFDRLAAFLSLEEVDPEAVDSSPSRGCECRGQQERYGRDEGTGRRLGSQRDGGGGASAGAGWPVQATLSTT